jgi:16S rRNA (cytosine1402-N4)-methyltransferase
MIGSEDQLERAAEPSSLGKPEPVHVPVMLREVLELLAPQPGQVIVDATVGTGGHAAVIWEALRPTGQLIGIDRDAAMLALARQRLPHRQVTLIHANFSELQQVLEELRIPRVHGLLADLGVASDQLDDPKRGFSFQHGGPLDMRMDPSEGAPASRWVNEASERELAALLRDYGEERYACCIAKAIVHARRHGPILTTTQLASIVCQAVPKGYERGRLHPATRTFQALRIAVNRELEHLEQLLRQLPNCLLPGGRAVIISFHSLEDRLVKRCFRESIWHPLTKKPLRPSEAEVRQNPRARSARLRAAVLQRPLPCRDSPAAEAEQ